jgi:CheY-specific phosphatase CheX
MQTVIFDPKSLSAALEGSISQVLETMFFTCVSTTGQDDRPQAAPELASGPARFGAHVRFSGQSEGEFAFSLDTTSLLPVAMDFLGRDDPPASDQEFGSIVCEMGNMFCGSLLSRLESDSVFHLAPPCLDRGEASFHPPAGAIRACFGLEPGELVAWIHVEDRGR